MGIPFLIFKLEPIESIMGNDIISTGVLRFQKDQISLRLIFRKNKVLLLICLLLVSGGSVMAKKTMKPGLCLTFDDRNMLHWEKQIPLFAKYNAHVTFFVDHFDELTADQLRALNELKKAGHAIGCHSMRHLRAPEYCAKNSVEKYLADEIEPAIKLMKEKGFFPTCFAYPFSDYNELTDNALLKYFRHLRTGFHVSKGMETTERVFVKMEDVEKTGRLTGVSFQPKSNDDDLIIHAQRAIDRIAKNKELLVFYAHDIRNPGEETPQVNITTDILEKIMAYAVTKKVKLYSYDELP